MVKSYQELVKEYGKLPNGFSALAPIIMPIILMALSSVGAELKWEGTLMIVLVVGLIFAVILLASAHKMGDFNALTNERLQVVGPTIFVIAALGVQFFNQKGESFIPVGGTLSEIASIDQTKCLPELRHTHIVGMCDIDNPLYGQSGAAYIFGPQKGADKHMVEMLDEGLVHVAEKVKEYKKSYI